MSELKYRVKIIEKNDGTKLYVPQVGNMFCFLLYDWTNIISENYGIDGFSNPSKNRTYYYDSEDIAISIIERYKQYLIEQDSKKVKSITYKEL